MRKHGCFISLLRETLFLLFAMTFMFFKFSGAAGKKTAQSNEFSNRDSNCTSIGTGLELNHLHDLTCDLQDIHSASFLKSQNCADDQIHVQEMLSKAKQEKDKATHGSLGILKQKMTSLHLELLQYLSTQHKENSCIDIATFDDLAKFTQSIRKHKWSCKLNEIYRLFTAIHKYRKQWLSEVSVAGKTITKHLPLGDLSDPKKSAEIYIQTDGKIIISYKNTLVGRGTYKNVHSHYGASLEEPKIGEVTPLVALTDSRKKGFSAIDSELNVYRYLEDFEKAHPESLPKMKRLIRTDVIELSNGKRALIQQRFDTHLEKRIHRLNSNQRVSTLLKVAEGLSQLHATGLVHGDLKEANILTSEDNSDVVIADFGLTYNPKQVVFPRSTPMYEAPEMVFEAKPTNDPSLVSKIQKRDVFSFGIIALHTLPGQKNSSLVRQCPFTYITSSSEWGRYGTCISKQAPIFHSKMVEREKRECPPIPREYCLQALIADCLNPDPDQRPSSQEVEDRLRNMKLN